VMPPVDVTCPRRRTGHVDSHIDGARPDREPLTHDAGHKRELGASFARGACVAQCQVLGD